MPVEKSAWMSVWMCSICGSEEETREEALKCESSGEPEPAGCAVGDVVRLDAQGLKSGPKYVRARVIGMRKSRECGRHIWVLELDRYVHLEECWGEGDDAVDPYMRKWVTADYLLTADMIRGLQPVDEFTAAMSFREENETSTVVQYPFQIDIYGVLPPETF